MLHSADLAHPRLASEGFFQNPRLPLNHTVGNGQRITWMQSFLLESLAVAGQRLRDARMSSPAWHYTGIYWEC